MRRSSLLWGAAAAAGAATVAVLVWRATRPAPTAAPSAPGAAPPAPAPNPPVPPGAEELEPDDDWEHVYQQGFSSALTRCIADPNVVAFDHAVVVLLEEIFPNHGPFALTAATGEWKRFARERARADLGDALGRTEAAARAALNLPVGERALAEGSDLGQAIRAMALHAFPATSWSDPSGTPWQALFCEAAAARLKPPQRSSGHDFPRPAPEVASVA